MPWRNINAVIENRLFLGKWVALPIYHLCGFCQTDLDFPVSWQLVLHARSQRIASRTSYLFALNIYLQNFLKGGSRICGLMSKMLIMLTSWSIYLRLVGSSTRPLGPEGLYSSIVAKACPGVPPLWQPIVGIHCSNFHDPSLKAYLFCSDVVSTRQRDTGPWYR